MILNIIVVIFVLGVGYAWMIRGMFNALIHLLCAVVAGAIAFAFWEILALKLIELSPERGFFSFIEGIAWGVALIIPFVVVFLLLRTLTDKLIPHNIRNSSVIDYIGGGICGLATGILCGGMLVLGIQTMRLPTDFLGYQPLAYSEDRAKGDGSLVRTDTLWIPVDRLTAMTYEMLSLGTMSTDEPLAKWYPEIELVGMASRVSPGNGSGRNVLAPDDFKIKSTYFVGNPQDTSSITDLLVDAREDRPQKYIDIDSQSISKGYLAGYVVEFQPGAKERGKKGGQLVVSNGQFRLLIEDNHGNTKTVFPIATISESSKPDQYGRWRFDSKDVFITSVGAKSRIPMAFEFVIPQGYSPVAFYAKNIRVLTDTLPDPIEYTTPSQRDELVRSGAILTGESSAKRKLITTNTLTYDPTGQPSLITRSTKLLKMMSTQIARRGFTLNEKNEIVDGEGEWLITEVGRKNAPTGKNLRVERYTVDRGQVLIKVKVGPDSEIGLLSEASRDAPLDQPLLLIDEHGNEYEAVGFEYTDAETFHARLTRGSTLTGIQDTPSMSRSRDDQDLIILFVVTKGINISHYTIGDVAIAEFIPPLDAE